MRECQLSDGEGVMGEEGHLMPGIGAPYSYGGMLWLRCLGIGGTEWEVVEQNGDRWNRMGICGTEWG